MTQSLEDKLQAGDVSNLSRSVPGNDTGEAPPHGDVWLTPLRGRKGNIAQVRLEEIKTKVNQGEDLTGWKKLPRNLVDFQSPQNKL